MGKLDLAGVCRKCGAHCCSYGGTTASRKELDRIIKAGHKNHFKKITGNVFVTKWGKNGVCPYLRNKMCSIYSARPALCRTYPVFMLGKNEFYLQHCPLYPHLSASQVKKAKKLLKSVSPELILGANRYLKPYEKILSKRIGKYKLETLRVL